MQSSFAAAADHALIVADEPSVMDALRLAFEHGGLLLTEAALSPAFFDLKTGLAGLALQKFTNYGARVAIVVPRPERYGERFRELAREHARHGRIRIMTDHRAAERWLTGTS